MILQDTDEALRREAEWIVDDIRDGRLELPDGTAGWVGYDSNGGRPMLKTRPGLFSGQLGIASFFAAMYRAFGDETYREFTADAVDFLLESDLEELTRGIGLGVASGYGSIVYGLSLLSDLTGEYRYRNRAHQFVDRLTETEIAADERYNVLAGAAGALAGLLRVYEQCGDATALDRAVACGEHLLDDRCEKWGYQVWNTYPNDGARSFTTGMGHGAAGICYSLYRLYAHTGREAFREAAADALGFENVFYSADHDNWKANWLSVPYYPRWWCYGVAGIGLARLGSLQYHDDPVLRRDLDRASAFEPQLAPTDSLCHGTFSQVELLIELGRDYDESYVERARALAVEAIERKRDSGGYRVAFGDLDGVCNPVLFLGTAGVGYTLVRLLEPEIPSILRFE